MSTKKNATATLPTVEAVNPSEAVIGANIRTDADLDPEFRASVAQHGVIVPVMAYRDESGAVVVVDGQRRTLAAVEAGQDTIPALIGQGPEDAERITRQWAANEARAQMSEGDRFDAIRQMSLLGMTAATISEQMSGVSKSDVAAVKKADQAGITPEDVNAAPELSLLDQAILADFSEDAEALRFLRGFTGDRLKDRVKDWRRKQQRQALLDQAVSEWQAKGATIDQTVLGYDDRRPSPRDLTTREGKTLPEDVETLAQMPGVVLGLRVSTRSVKQDDDTVTTEDYLDVTARVQDPAKNGYMRKFRDDTGHLLDAEQAKAERRAAREAKEQWAADQQARRDFIAGLLDAKTPPAAVEAILCAWVTQGWTVALYQAAPLFGRDAGKIQAELDRKRTTAKRRLTIAAVLALMGWEAKVSPDTARHPRSIDRTMFDALVKNGYTPTETDQGIAGT